VWLVLNTAPESPAEKSNVAARKAAKSGSGRIPLP